MKLYSIHYKGDGSNPVTFEGVTDNFDKWLEEHNDGRENQEDEDDFEVEEIGLCLYDVENENNIDLNQYIQYDENVPRRLYVNTTNLFEDALEYIQNDNVDYEITEV